MLAPLHRHPPPFPLAPSRKHTPLLALIVRIVNFPAGETTQTPLPRHTLPAHPCVALFSSLHPVGTRPRVEAVQFGVAALSESCLEGEGTGGTGGDEDVAHFGRGHRCRWRCVIWEPMWYFRR